MLSSQIFIITGAIRNNCGIPMNDVLEPIYSRLNFFSCFIISFFIFNKSLFLIQPEQFISNRPVFNSGNGLYYYTYSPIVLPNNSILLHPINLLKWRLIHINSVLFLKKFEIPLSIIFLELVIYNIGPHEGIHFL